MRVVTESKGETSSRRDEADQKCNDPTSFLYSIEHHDCIPTDTTTTHSRLVASPSAPAHLVAHLVHLDLSMLSVAR